MHDSIANRGQTEVPSLEDDVDYHFIAFVEKNGHLYDLDGCKSGPLNCGETSKETFLKDAAKVCKSYMELDPENIKFTVLALASNNWIFQNGKCQDGKKFLFIIWEFKIALQ